MSKATELATLLRGVESLVVVCHDNPDPDCLASALALEAIAEAAGVKKTTIAYGGDISHQQNRAFVAMLEMDVRELESVELTAYEALAFVDHSKPGSNTELPSSVLPDIVIDHHPGEPISTTVTDIRADYGATATIFVEYLLELKTELTSRLASALLFALHRERLDFVRSPTRREYEAALAVYPVADLEVLDQLYGSAFTPSTLDAIGRAITSRHRQGSSLVTGIGRTDETDALPQAADYLLNLEGIDTVLVYGFINDRIRLSARSIDPQVNVGRLLIEAYDELGTVGGHHDMAGGQIALEQFTDELTDDSVLAGVGTRLERRFFDALLESEE